MNPGFISVEMIEYKHLFRKWLFILCLGTDTCVCFVSLPSSKWKRPWEKLLRVKINWPMKRENSRYEILFSDLCCLIF